MIVIFSSSRPLLLSSCIFPEDEKSATVCAAILETIKEKAKLLDQWRAIHETEFGCDHGIPSSEEMNIVKLNEAVVSSDACNAARLTSD